MNYSTFLLLAIVPNAVLLQAASSPVPPIGILSTGGSSLRHPTGTWLASASAGLPGGGNSSSTYNPSLSSSRVSLLASESASVIQASGSLSSLVPLSRESASGSSSVPSGISFTGSGGSTGILGTATRSSSSRSDVSSTSYTATGEPSVGSGVLSSASGFTFAPSGISFTASGGSTGVSSSLTSSGASDVSFTRSGGSAGLSATTAGSSIDSFGASASSIASPGSSGSPSTGGPSSTAGSSTSGAPSPTSSSVLQTLNPTAPSGTTPPITITSGPSSTTTLVGNEFTSTSIKGVTANTKTTTSEDGHQTVLPIIFCLRCGGGGGGSSGLAWIIHPPGINPPGGIELNIPGVDFPFTVDPQGNPTPVDPSKPDPKPENKDNNSSKSNESNSQSSTREGSSGSLRTSSTALSSSSSSRSSSSTRSGTATIATDADVDPYQTDPPQEVIAEVQDYLSSLFAAEFDQPGTTLVSMTSSLNSTTPPSGITSAPSSDSVTATTSATPVTCQHNAINQDPPNCIEPSSSSHPFSCSAGSNVGVATYDPATWCGCNKGSDLYPTLTTGTGNAACAYTTPPGSTVNPTQVKPSSTPPPSITPPPPNSTGCGSTHQSFDDCNKKCDPNLGICMENAGQKFITCTCN